MKINTAPGQNIEVTKEQNKQLMDVSKGFESILLNQMLSTMRSTVSKDDGIVPQSHAEKMYESMLDTEYAQNMTDTGGLGIAKMVYEHLLRTMPGG